MGCPSSRRRRRAWSARGVHAVAAAIEIAAVAVHVRPTVPKSEHDERDRERALLRVLGPSRDAGGANSLLDRRDLLCVVAGEQRAQPPDLLAAVRLTGMLIIHGTTILRLLDPTVDPEHERDLGVPGSGLPRLSPARRSRPWGMEPVGSPSALRALEPGRPLRVAASRKCR
jgi:hypothetical protein